MDLDTAAQLTELTIDEEVTIHDEIWTRVDSETWTCAPWGDEDPGRGLYQVTHDEIAEVLGVDDQEVAFEARHRLVFDMRPSDYVAL